MIDLHDFNQVFLTTVENRCDKLIHWARNELSAKPSAEECP